MVIKVLLLLIFLEDLSAAGSRTLKSKYIIQGSRAAFKEDALRIAKIRLTKPRPQAKNLKPRQLLEKKFYAKKTEPFALRYFTREVKDPKAIEIAKKQAEKQAEDYKKLKQEASKVYKPKTRQELRTEIREATKARMGEKRMSPEEMERYRERSAEELKARVEKIREEGKMREALKEHRQKIEQEQAELLARQRKQTEPVKVKEDPIDKELEAKIKEHERLWEEEMERFKEEAKQLKKNKLSNLGDKLKQLKNEAKIINKSINDLDEHINKLKSDILNIEKEYNNVLRNIRELREKIEGIKKSKPTFFKGIRDIFFSPEKVDLEALKKQLNDECNRRDSLESNKLKKLEELGELTAEKITLAKMRELKMLKIIKKYQERVMIVHEEGGKEAQSKLLRKLIEANRAKYLKERP